MEMEEHENNKQYQNKTQQLRACKQMEGLNMGLTGNKNQ